VKYEVSNLRKGEGRVGFGKSGKDGNVEGQEEVAYDALFGQGVRIGMIEISIDAGCSQPRDRGFGNP